MRRETGVIPGAVHVPLSVLYWQLDSSSGHDDPELSDPSRQVILVCAHGCSSSLAAATLRDLGFDRSTDVVGGFEAWQAAGLPVIPPAADPAEVLIVGARVLAHADGLEAGLGIVLGSIAEQFEIGSAAIFVVSRQPDRLEIAATFGLGEAAAAGLANAVRDPGHPIARTVATPVPAFRRPPDGAWGPCPAQPPAARHHPRDSTKNVVGVVALAHDHPIAMERDDGARPPADVELAVFRMAQEALANAVTHGAPPVVVRYAAASDRASLSVTDRGAGIGTDAASMAARSGHYGLLNMRQRAEQIGAKLDVRRPSDGGTVIGIAWASR